MTSRSYFDKMNSTLGSVVPLAMFFHDGQGMSTDMFGCYQKFGPQQIRYYLIAVWVNIDVDVQAERFVFRKGRV